MVLEKTHTLTLHDDDEHSFEYVIACLMELCKHESIQAQQCASIVNGVGKYDIKSGSFDDIFDLKVKLEEVGLITEISENESNLH
jgi:ATP-dependent Clp protease adaptor protein ClpS